MKPFLPTITAARFARMGQRAKIVAIARDVVARIDSGYIHASMEHLFKRLPGPDHDIPFQESVNSGRCEVCAKGALACSFVGALNRFEKSDFCSSMSFINNNAGSRELVSIFGATLWDTIEVAFEKRDFYWTSDIVSAQKDLIIDSFKRYRSPTGRMRAVYQNLVEHKGHLRLKDGTFIS